VFTSTEQAMQLCSVFMEKWIKFVRFRKTMKDIKRDNSVGDRWVLNYVATYANAVCMVAYTMPTKQYFLAIINAVAVFAEFGYSCFYRHYAEGRAKTIATWAILGELLWGAIVLAAYFSAFFGGRREDLRVKLFGTLGAVTSGAMYLAMIPDTVHLASVLILATSNFAKPRLIH
jgi:hypothetical protein